MLQRVGAIIVEKELIQRFFLHPFPDLLIAVNIFSDLLCWYSLQQICISMLYGC
jgi:hypothetical protein